MLRQHSFRCSILLALSVTLLAAAGARAQVEIGGDMMLRSYWEKFTDTRDDRGDLNYMRLLGRLYLDAPVGDMASFHADLVTISENPVFATRSIAGTGSLHYGLSQLYGEIVTDAVPGFDMSRFRFGRQHYKLGQGLTLGDSYYMLDNYDGVRADLSRGPWTVGLFGSITEQELSPGGYYPRQGSDQLYVGKVEYDLYDHTLLGYSVYEKSRGDFNDNIVTGLGANGSIVLRNLKYFGEVATQRFNTPAGLPDKGGMAYMAGVSYSWSAGPFRIIKVEARGAGYEGDDAETGDVEIFEPFYPSWFWGDRTAYVNGGVGGDYPHRGIRPEGSRIWYGRMYFSLASIPKARLQLQYSTVDDWVNNDDVTEPNDEWGVKLFYQLSSNVRLQGRFMKRVANSEDVDVNNSGSITRIEDRHDAQRVMFEARIQF